jgi:hypothetical protein
MGPVALPWCSRCVAGSTVGRLAAGQAWVAATAKIGTALDTFPRRDARRQRGDSGGYGRARVAAMLAERQRQANIAEEGDPGRCYADDRSRTLWPARRSCRASV